KNQPAVKAGDCATIREEWESWCKFAQGRFKNDSPRGKRFAMALKGCKRIFDVECSPCDKIASADARSAWDKRVAEDCSDGDSLSKVFLPLLKSHVRELVSGWGAKLESARKDPSGIVACASDIYVPDQQGCLETRKLNGGTLATRPDEEDTRTESLGIVRRGCAKTKGKYRVVTMQSSYVKRVLRPVHNGLYNYISSFNWCVRGDVTRRDFEDVCASNDEEIISGDYSDATNNIYLPVVEAIVEVLSEDPDLTEEERRVLVGSFTNIRWVSKSGKLYPIKRGSMMGNLCSFPLLCLLNKACHDISSDLVYGVGVKRIVRINGDDCLFKGNRAMYATWRYVTHLFGLVVNESKTLVSHRWADLNSQTYDARRRRLISKPVLSFLLPPRHATGEILTSVLSGISSFRTEVKLWIVNCLMRHEISLRGFSLSGLSSFWVKVLVRRKWFRRMVMDGPATTITTVPGGREGVGIKPKVMTTDRPYPVTLGPPPHEKYYPVIDYCSSILTKSHVEAWTGVKILTPQVKLDRASFALRQKNPYPFPSHLRFVGVSVRWAFVWPSSLLQIVQDQYPWMLVSDKDCLVKKSIPDHPYLTLEHRIRVTRTVNPHPPYRRPGTVLSSGGVSV
ncbi:RNA-dependent RNA polymerase, partial [Sclerotinia sclerotiorum ourmia-like virus 2]